MALLAMGGRLWDSIGTGAEEAALICEYGALNRRALLTGPVDKHETFLSSPKVLKIQALLLESVLS